MRERLKAVLRNNLLHSTEDASFEDLTYLYFKRIIFLAVKYTLWISVPATAILTYLAIKYL